MIIELDIEKLSSKPLLLKELSLTFDEMFGLNYDALIDAATFCPTPITFKIFNIDKYENEKDLREIFEIITNENPKVKFLFV